jgi:serine phosphatase RsbU (regulator of sigma subunit)
MTAVMSNLDEDESGRPYSGVALPGLPWQRGPSERQMPEMPGVWVDEPLRMLLIEDDVGDAVLVEELFADSGLDASLTWCRSLAEARVHLAAGPTCVLLDLNLPDSVGLPSVAEVLESAPGAVVLVLTGLADEQTAIAAVNLGAQDYLVKGRVDGQLLSRSIRYAIERKAAVAAAAELRETRILAEQNSRIERGLLPRPLVGEGSRIRTASRYRAGRQRALLGGDFFDVVETGPASFRMLIGDVCGHGPDEAALGVGLRFAWRGLVLAGTDPVTVLETLEQVCVAERHMAGIYASICMIDIELPEPGGVGSATVTCAGHPAPFLIVDGTVTSVPTGKGMPVGLLPGRGSGWHPVDAPLPVSGGLLLYTDGLTDCQTGPGVERLGSDGLARVAKGVWQPDPERFLDDLVAAVVGPDAGRNLDDLAVLYVLW